jgi:hypothetical protein
MISSVISTRLFVEDVSDIIGASRLAVQIVCRMGFAREYFVEIERASDGHDPG